MRVSEIRVKRIRVNQGLGVYGMLAQKGFQPIEAPMKFMIQISILPACLNSCNQLYG